MSSLIESELNPERRGQKRSEAEVNVDDLQIEGFQSGMFHDAEAKRMKLPSINMINTLDNLAANMDDDSADDESVGNHAAPLNRMPPMRLPTQQLQQYEAEMHTKTPRKSRAKPQSEMMGRVRWTEEMDARLKQAVELHGNQWKDVATAVGFDKNPTQCFKRWTWYINPALDNKKTGPWTEDEIDLMRVLVEQNSVRHTSRGPKEAINWSYISKELNRNYYDCKNKHKLLLASEMKKGLFTQEEDDLILQRIQEWGNKGNGLWVSLERDLNRRADTIKTRAIKNRFITPIVPAKLQQAAHQQQDLIQQQQQQLIQLHTLQQQAQAQAAQQQAAHQQQQQQQQQTQGLVQQEYQEYEVRV